MSKWEQDLKTILTNQEIILKKLEGIELWNQENSKIPNATQQTPKAQNQDQKTNHNYKIGDEINGKKVVNITKDSITIK